MNSEMKQLIDFVQAELARLDREVEELKAKVDKPLTQIERLKLS